MRIFSKKLQTNAQMPQSISLHEVTGKETGDPLHGRREVRRRREICAKGQERE